jgi:hypothetical protein
MYQKLKEKNRDNREEHNIFLFIFYYKIWKFTPKQYSQFYNNNQTQRVSCASTNLIRKTQIHIHITWWVLFWGNKKKCSKGEGESGAFDISKINWSESFASLGIQKLSF